jgi:xanthine/CO dehydrogenase XdhC/CoxF family maturation factor
MKEIQEILKKIQTLQSKEKAILATVVDVQGSSYRLPGAKMLVLENGDTFGTVSGGCLEADILERAKQVLENGRPEVFVYDTTRDLDSVFSLNMGCRGIIKILLEPVTDNKLLEFIQTCLADQQKGMSATLIDPKDENLLGKRLLIENDQIVHSDFDEEVSKEILSFAKNLRNSDEQMGQGLYTFEIGNIFFDEIILPINLHIFGAGADAVPLATIAKNLGWYVTVIDHREAFANSERFQNADKILISHPEQTAENINLNENSVAVIMTHNYEHDKNILRVILNSKAIYIGKLGPKRRSENMLSELKEDGFEYDSEKMQKFYSPIGLDIGADTPEAIALAILAEIQTVIKNRQGGFLRNRTGSIYGRN